MAGVETQQRSEFRELTPLFKTRGVEIKALSTDPHGLQVITGEFLRRPPARQILLAQGEYGEDILNKITAHIRDREIPRAANRAIKDGLNSPEEKARIRIMQELFGLNDDQIRQYIERLTSEKMADPRLLSKYEHSRLIRYMEETNKLAIFSEEISRDGRTLRIKARKSPYAFYAYIRTPEDERRGLLELANPTGVATVIETTDGWIGLGRRGPKNTTYRASDESGGQPGAWAAGIMDLSMSRLTPPGEPERIDNSKVRRMADKELTQETGISSKTYAGKYRVETEDITEFATRKMLSETGEIKADIEEMKIVCFAKDLVQPHNEFGVVAKSSKTKDQLIQIHNDMHRSDDEYDFSEEVFFIPATPDAVKMFVTRCRTPMPFTHYPPLIGLMYNKMVAGGMTRRAISGANKWLREVEQGLDDNFRAIDEIVANTYRMFPHLIEENAREAKRDRINTNGFDPAVLADRQLIVMTSQGLKSITLNGELEALNFAA